MKTYLTVFSTCILLLCTLVFSYQLSAQIDWEHHDQPVMDYGTSGEWDCCNLIFPVVIKDGDTLRMWYTGLNGMLISPSTIWGFGYAWSLDGISWNRDEGNPIPEIASGPVMKDGDTLKTWFTDGEQNLFYATSLNGKKWEKHAGSGLALGPAGDWDDGGGFWGPNTVIKEDNLYKMWYVGSTGNLPYAIHQIGYATSTDGLHWEKYDDPTTTDPPFSHSDPVLKVGETGEWDEMRAAIAFILPKDNGYEMWYSGMKTNLAEGQWIGYATSEDGINWTKDANNPIISSCPQWGKFGYLTGAVLKFNGYYHMWYSSFDMYGDRGRFGYAVSEIPDKVADLNNNIFPENFSLSQNYPNPFNPKTTISYQLPIDSFIELSIYSVLGQKIETLVSEPQQAGIHNFEWDASGLTSGVYFYQLKAGKNVETKKLILLR